MDSALELWEVLVPTMKNDRPVRTRYHKIWDVKVREIAGGLSLIKPIVGQWHNPDTQELCVERMIPVRIACTRAQINKILEFTLEYYDQHTVMAYRISDEVLFKTRS